MCFCAALRHLRDPSPACCTPTCTPHVAAPHLEGPDLTLSHFGEECLQDWPVHQAAAREAQSKPDVRHVAGASHGVEVPAAVTWRGRIVQWARSPGTHALDAACTHHVQLSQSKMLVWPAWTITECGSLVVTCVAPSTASAALKSAHGRRPLPPRLGHVRLPTLVFATSSQSRANEEKAAQHNRVSLAGLRKWKPTDSSASNSDWSTRLVTRLPLRHTARHGRLRVRPRGRSVQCRAPS